MKVIEGYISSQKFVDCLRISGIPMQSYPGSFMSISFGQVIMISNKFGLSENFGVKSHI